MKKTKKTVKNPKINIKKDFIFKDGNEIHILNIADLQNMPYHEALDFVQVTYLEQKNQLILEAKGKIKPIIVEGIDLLVGLELSLSKLNEIWPGIRETASKIELRKNAGRIFQC